ncbi:S-adenosyl-L-methionine-dependent methyltransferase [Hypoxylon argillaceum]|nr:S-adenosyl-L-methionine-dependent methyltransferase [Hypoxylon argillaceum]
MAPSDSATDQHPAPALAPALIKVKLSPVEETMILTLWCRARDAASAKPKGGDVYAQAILDRVDKASFGSSMFPRDSRFGDYIAVRARLLDEWCRTFLEAHAGVPVTVLHLGCGLDLRVLRVRPSCGGDVRWIDIDRPEVVNLRRRLIPDPIRPSSASGAGGEDREREWDYRLIGASVTDESWTAQIPPDRPLLVIGEGLFPYLTPDEAAALLRQLVERAPAGGQVLMDTVGSLMVRYQALAPLFRSTRVRMRWGVDDGEDVARAHPRLRLNEALLFCDLLPGAFASGAPPFLGVLTPLFSLLPGWRTYGQLLRLEF